MVPYMVAAYFGQRRFSTLYGLTWTAYAIGPVLLGRSFDHNGYYAAPVIVALALPCLLAAAMQLLLPRTTHRSASPIETLASTAEPAV